MNQIMTLMGSIGAAGMDVETPTEVQDASHKFNKSLLAYTISLANSSLGLFGGNDMLEKVKSVSLSNTNLLVDGFLQAHGMYAERIEKKDKSVFDDLPIRPSTPSEKISDENLQILWMHLKKLRKNSLKYKLACSKSGHKSLSQVNIPDSLSKSLETIRGILKKNNVDKKTFTNVVIDLAKSIPGIIKLFEQLLPANMKLDTGNCLSDESLDKIRNNVENYLF